MVAVAVPIEADGVGVGDGHAHVADEVGGSFERLDIHANLVQIDRVGDVAKLGCAEVADHCAEALGGRGDLARHEQLAGLGLPRDAGGQVDRGSVVVAVEGDGSPVVGAGAGEQYGVWCQRSLAG